MNNHALLARFYKQAIKERKKELGKYQLEKEERERERERMQTCLKGEHLKGIELGQP